MTSDDAAAFRLLTRLFIRRLLDNDLLSPRADRHESLAVLYAAVVSLAVFTTFFISTNYLAAFIQFPGPAALSALSDRFLFIAASIAISALAALMVWDALSLEARDAAILGPLPIAMRAITRAKLGAVVLFGAALTIALNAVPSVLYPIFLTMNIRGTRGATVLQLIAAHAATVIMAGLFGFFGVLGIRGILRSLLGERVFRRASNAVQSALIVSVMTGLLLAPTVRAKDVRSWVSGAQPSPSPARPILWYLGLHETLAGHLVNETPLVAPRLISLEMIPKQGDQLARSLYRAMIPQFALLARRAWLSLPIVLALALTTFLWTNRRLPDRAAGAPAPSRIRVAIRLFAEQRTQRDPEAQAGFFFALQTLTRSAPHRTILAIALAVGLTQALIVLAQNTVRSAEIPSTTAGVFAIAILLLAAFLAGIVRAVTVPAEPAANWTIRMAWLGDERGYLTGVKRAAMLLVTGLVIVLLPLHVKLLGASVAAVHSLLGLLFATIALDILFLSYRKLPFACSYIPIENPKFAWPAGLASLLAVTYGFATMERRALQTVIGAIVFGGTLVIMAMLVKAVDAARRHEPPLLNFDDRPSLPTQRLGLFEHVAILD